MLRPLLDRTLDLTVVPGFSRVGYLARRGTFDPLPRMEGRTILVTGATAGLGRETAQQCAALGARVLLLARDRARGERAVQEIVAATGNADVELVLGDLSSVASVRAAAADVQARVPALHALVNNAGVLSGERRLSVDGVELTFATNVLGLYLLTELLLPLMRSSAPARIVNVTSGGMLTQALDLDDVQTERRAYDGPGAYARTKRAEMVLTAEWARRLDGTGVVVHAMHPGWADTPGVQESLPRFRSVMRPLLRTAQEGADTIVWLVAAAEPARSTGRLWHDRQVRSEHRLRSTRGGDDDGARLMAICDALVAAADAAAAAQTPG
jgi:NAD(P)-dependent dehydrogenase (short-subunit alcohol dehydrogenase family)